MKTWIITENDIRDIIRNCDEIISADRDEALHDGRSCLIREKFIDNPLYNAVYNAVDCISNVEAIKFIRSIRLHLEYCMKSIENLPNDFGIKLLINAIEVESPRQPK